MSEPEFKKLLDEPLSVINAGLERFAQDLDQQGVKVVHVDWAPPAGGDSEFVKLLSRLETLSHDREDVTKRIEDANQKALKRMLSGDPVLVDVIPASEAIPELKEHMILHAGPPIGWNRMCGPMRGAVAGIAVFEGWAPDLKTAEGMATEGAFDFQPNHQFDAVGPMTGMTTISQPLLAVENRRFGNRAFCAINEGLGKVMRFGGNDEEVLNRLRWIRDVLGPTMGAALRAGDGMPLKGLVARGLSMGDAVVGISASGRTPFVIGAMEAAREIGARTIAITCDRDSPLAECGEIAIVPEVGPEVVAGSTRMKGGLAQKMVLHLLSTTLPSPQPNQSVLLCS